MSIFFELAGRDNPEQHLIDIGVERVIVKRMQSIIGEATSFDDIGSVVSRRDLNMGGAIQLTTSLIRPLYDDDPKVREFFQCHLSASTLPQELKETYVKNGIEGLISYRFSHPEIDAPQIESFLSTAKVASYNFLRTYFGLLTYPQDYHVDIPRPDLKAYLSWATIVQTRMDWLRVACPQAGFDTAQVILGEGIGDIYGDDPNSFGMFHQPEYIEEKRKTFEIRMNIRINTPEIPEDIRNRLAEVKDHALAIDWNKESGWQEAKTYYKKKAANYTQHQVALHQEYRNAKKVSDVADLVFSSAWHAFLGEI